MNGRIFLRRAGQRDADAITALTRAAYARWIPVIGREPLPMTVDYAEAVRRHRFDLLHADGVLAALIETTPQGEYLLIENVAVLPAFQGRGLGQRLLAHAEHLAALAELRGVRLYTNRRFAANLRLYDALGYRVEREAAVNGGVAVHMIKARPDRAAQAQRLRGYFDLQLRLAARLAELTPMGLGEAALLHTTLHRQFGFGAAEPKGPSPEWARFADPLERLGGDEERLAWTLRFFTETRAAAPRPDQFGCFGFDPPDAEGTARIHFSNRDSSDGVGPLASKKMGRRLTDLACLFADLRERYPETRTIRGGSWLYNLEAYRRLFPPAYVASRRAPASVRLGGASTWGQLLDHTEAVKPAIRQALLSALPSLDVRAPWRAFPLHALAVEAPVEVFHDFPGYRTWDA